LQHTRSQPHTPAHTHTHSQTQPYPHSPQHHNHTHKRTNMKLIFISKQTHTHTMLIRVHTSADTHTHTHTPAAAAAAEAAARACAPSCVSSCAEAPLPKRASCVPSSLSFTCVCLCVCVCMYVLGERKCVCMDLFELVRACARVRLSTPLCVRLHITSRVLHSPKCTHILNWLHRASHNNLSRQMDDLSICDCLRWKAMP